MNSKAITSKTEISMWICKHRYGNNQKRSKDKIFQILYSHNVSSTNSGKVAKRKKRKYKI
jgi:hypothetical protein